MSLEVFPPLLCLGKLSGQACLLSTQMAMGNSGAKGKNVGSCHEGSEPGYTTVPPAISKVAHTLT